MARRNTNTANRTDGMHMLSRLARGSGEAAMAAEDREQEAGCIGDLLLSVFQIGEVWYIETATWTYIGEVWRIGRDFVALRRAVRVHDDGKHGEFFRDGDRTNAEIESTGGPDGLAILPLDWIGPCSPWPHAIPLPH